MAPARGDGGNEGSLTERDDVRAFIEQMVERHGFERPWLQDLFGAVQIRSSIIAALDKPATSRPWYQFQGNFLNEHKTREGIAFWRQHKEWLDKARAEYGVAPEYVVAILGVETGYGRNAGSFRAIDALSTIAFDYPRRADYFKEQLENFLLLAREENRDPLDFKSSYAGALGMPQFMPASFREFAVDFDADGQRDIWRNPADAIGSVAYYFKKYGWQADAPVAVRAEAEGDQVAALLADKFNLHYSVAELAERGVKPAEALPAGDKAVLFSLETEPGVNEYWLGLGNFYAITRYNRSVNYAMAINLLARRLREAYEHPETLAPEPAKSAAAGKRHAQSPARHKPAKRAR